MGAVVEKEFNPVCVGIDVGQISDPTAIAVAEVAQIETGKYRYGRERILPHVDKLGQFHEGKDADPVLATEYLIRHIRRLPLGTSYPDVAQIITEMLCSPLFSRRKVQVLIDVTGVGRPVYDSLMQEIATKEATKRILIKPITFSHGERYNITTGLLGKAYLVSRLQSLLQSGRVKAPLTPEVKALLEELRVYEIKVSQDGKDQYGAIIGKHDDLATALALACLEDPYGMAASYSERVY
jgi:hypothetical protein